MEVRAPRCARVLERLHLRVRQLRHEREQRCGGRGAEAAQRVLEHRPVPEPGDDQAVSGAEVHLGGHERGRRGVDRGDGHPDVTTEDRHDVADGPQQARTRPGGSTIVESPGLELFVRASARLRREVPFDSAGWTATDPTTLLPTSPALVENVDPGGCTLHWSRELALDDVLRFRDLAGSAHPGGTLGAATDGDPNRSARFRDLLGPMGYGDELRAAFRTGADTWAVVCLLRARGRTPFTPRDVDRVLEPARSRRSPGRRSSSATARCGSGTGSSPPSNPARSTRAGALPSSPIRWSSPRSSTRWSRSPWPRPPPPRSGSAPAP